MTCVGLRKNVRGVSILELLLAMVIGLVVVGAVLVTYIGSGRNSAVQSSYSQMNDDAQIALNLLSRDLQLAGYAQATSVNSDGKFVRTPLGVGTVTAVFGCDYRFSVPNALGAVACPASPPSSAIEKIPSLEVVYEADINNTPPSSGGKPTDCLGTGIDTQVSGNVNVAITRNRYFLEIGNRGRRELYCASNAQDSAGNQVSRQPLVENVDNIKFWYGVGGAPNPAAAPASAAVERQVSKYVEASSVTANEWDRIVSVRICILMKSPEPVLGSEDDPTYLDCDGNSQTGSVPAPSPADPLDSRYLRRAYFTTVTLRNKMDF